MSIASGESLCRLRPQLRSSCRGMTTQTLDELLSAATGWTRHQLYAEPEKVLDTAAVGRVRNWCRRWASGEPLERILNRCVFCDLELQLDDSVLIPRPETEQLVQLGAGLLPSGGSALDMGTGSGAIALALAAARPDAAITAVDSSASALGIARHNAQRLGLDSVVWQASHWFGSLGFADLAGARFDLIVSNPPYVESSFAGLDELLRYEPKQALVAGDSGLECIAVLAAQAPDFVRPQGWLVLEHGADRGDEVCELLRAHGWAGCFSVRDDAGRQRFSGGQRA